ncbi:MAG: DUF433 domain-containing protein [Bryobacteraceae bacterium]
MLPLIVTDPKILNGEPCIRGTRLSVEFVLELIASGAGIGEIAMAYPPLSDRDIADAVGYAARHLHDSADLEVEIAG